MPEYFYNFQKKNKMKRTLIYLSALMGLFFQLSSCIMGLLDSISGDGNVKTVSREVADFKSVEASNGLNVFITFGNTLSMEVEADENLHDVILTEVNSGVLRVHTNKNIRNATAKNVRITVPDLEDIEVSSAADVRCENILKTERLEISVSSAGQLRLETDAKEVIVEASSSGSMELRGKADDMNINVSSAGSIDADRLEVKFCRVSASSAGNADVWVTEQLNADASSAGNIQYKGEPANKKIDTSSAGSVSQR
jgi:hypothetical protein